MYSKSIATSSDLHLSLSKTGDVNGDKTGDKPCSEPSTRSRPRSVSLLDRASSGQPSSKSDTKSTERPASETVKGRPIAPQAVLDCRRDSLVSLPAQAQRQPVKQTELYPAETQEALESI